MLAHCTRYIKIAFEQVQLRNLQKFDLTKKMYITVASCYRINFFNVF